MQRSYETPGGASSPVASELMREGIYLMERPTVLAPVASVASNTLIIGGTGILAGISVRENGGGAAVWDLLDGLDANGEELFPIGLATGGTVQVQMGRDGPMFRRGLFLKRTSGTIICGVWVKI